MELYRIHHTNIHIYIYVCMYYSYMHMLHQYVHRYRSCHDSSFTHIATIFSIVVVSILIYAMSAMALRVLSPETGVVLQ